MKTDPRLLLFLFAIIGALGTANAALAAIDKAPDMVEIQTRERPAKADTALMPDPAADSKPAALQLDGEQQWLQLDSAPAQAALYRLDRGDKTRGATLIIPDSQHGAAAVDIINPLRHSLARHHWQTLTLDRTADNNREHRLAGIAAAIAFLQQRGMYNVVLIGEGDGAATALRYLLTARAQPSSSTVRAAILINARDCAALLSTEDSSALQRLPILDIHFTPDRLQQGLAQQRQRLALVLNWQQYRQLQLPRLASNWSLGEDRLSKHLRGWLDQRAGLRIPGRR